MTDPCNQKERIAKLETEQETLFSLIKDFKSEFVSFKSTFNKTMLGLIASIVIASFHLGGYKNLPDSFAKLNDKVTNIESKITK
jgi:hypothetical protein